MVKRYGWAGVLLAVTTLVALAPSAARAADANTCGYTQGPGGWYKSTDRSGPYSLDGNCVANLLGLGGGGGPGGSGTGSAASNPSYTVPAGITRAKISCTVPAYAAGGSMVCTNDAGQQTTTTCGASTACLLSGANANRKTAFLMQRTSGVTCDVGYGSATAPGTALGVDGPSTSGGQGGSVQENPAHVGTYYVACPSAATVIFVQGQ